MYKFSNYYKRNTRVISTHPDQSRYISVLKQVPLVGPNVTKKGIGAYVRGKNFDVNHMDNFIKSDTNFMMSQKQQFHESQPVGQDESQPPSRPNEPSDRYAQKRKTRSSRMNTLNRIHQRQFPMPFRSTNNMSKIRVID